MTRRVLTTIGSATAVATAVGACLLLGPTPQAQAADCPPPPNTGLFGISSTCIFGTNGGNTGYVTFTGGGHGQACAVSGGKTTCKSF
jgi:hypothetical protein